VKTLDGLRARDEQCHVVLVDAVRGDEELPLGLVALITPHEVPHLSHLAIRARQQQVVMACARDVAATSELRAWQGRRVVVDTSALARAVVRLATDRDAPTVRSTWASPPTPVSCTDGAADEERWLPLEAATLATSGAKADASRKLLTIARAYRGAFDAPPGLVIPFGALEAAVRADAAVGRRYDELRDQLQHARGPAAGALAAQLTELTGGLAVPDDVVLAIQDGFHATDRLMVRSSANTEDLESFAGARLHESVPNVRPALMHNAVQVVWASLWTLRAVAGRAQQGIAQQAARMAVLIQPMIAADYAFVAHTVNPVSLDARQVVVELVLGMGETLARSDEPGTPYRMIYDTQTELVQVLAFESLSYGRWPEDSGPLRWVRINHAEVRMSRDRELQRLVVRKVAMVSKAIASALEAPQDIEGVIVGGRVVIVQSRRQQGAPL
jgi:phosphoglucan,water dikinase